MRAPTSGFRMDGSWGGVMTVHVSPIVRRILRDADATTRFLMAMRARDSYNAFEFEFEGRRYLMRNGGERERGTK